jgi:hypothetical protein
MLAMLFAMSANSFAENNNAIVVKNYEIKVNTKSLSNYLNLSKDQKDMVEMITDEFSRDMIFAGVECNDTNRLLVTRNAIEKNIKSMSYVLNGEQYNKYLKVLNITLLNRNININK